MIKKILSLIPLLLLALRGFLVAQDLDPFIQAKVNMVSYDSIYFNHQQFDQLGVKEVGSQSLNNTGNWIIDFYQQNGYTDIEIDSFYIGPNLVYNIVVTKTGTTFPDTYLIIDGHYDTYNGPGANDNGSGTVVLLETARILAEVETKYSLKFIHFTAEEIGLVGSTHYVENIVIPEDLDIRLVFNIDGVGGVAGEVNNTVTCERDQSPPNWNNAESAAFTDTLASITEMYTNLNTEISYAYASDYVPFMENGHIVTGLYENNISPYYHTIYDNLLHLDSDYVFEIAKASVAATLYFANGFEGSNGIRFNEIFSKNFDVYPNPFIGFFEIENPTNEQIQLSLLDISGREVFKSSIASNSIKRLIPKCDPGMYLLLISSMNEQVIYTDKIIKQ